MARTSTAKPKGGKAKTPAASIAQARLGDDDDEPKGLDEPVTPEDCDAYHNIMGTSWGATAKAAAQAATAEAAKVYKTLVLKCPDCCPVPKKDKSVGKARPNQFVIRLPFAGAPIIINFGFVCDYEVIYGCFKKSANEPV